MFCVVAWSVAVVCGIVGMFWVVVGCGCQLENIVAEFCGKSCEERRIALEVAFGEGVFCYAGFYFGGVVGVR